MADVTRKIGILGLTAAGLALSFATACSSKDTSPSTVAVVQFSGELPPGTIINGRVLDEVEFQVYYNDSQNITDDLLGQVALDQYVLTDSSTGRPIATTMASLYPNREIAIEAIGYVFNGVDPDTGKTILVEVGRSKWLYEETGDAGSDEDFTLYIPLNATDPSLNSSNTDLTAIGTYFPVFTGVWLNETPVPDKQLTLDASATIADPDDEISFYYFIVSGDPAIKTNTVFIPGGGPDHAQLQFALDSGSVATIGVIALADSGLCSFVTYDIQADPEFQLNDQGSCYAYAGKVQNNISGWAIYAAALQSSKSLAFVMDIGDENGKSYGRITTDNTAFYGTINEQIPSLNAFGTRATIPGDISNPNPDEANYLFANINFANGCVENYLLDLSAFPTNLAGQQPHPLGMACQQNMNMEWSMEPDPAIRYFSGDELDFNATGLGYFSAAMFQTKAYGFMAAGFSARRAEQGSFYTGYATTPDNMEDGGYSLVVVSSGLRHLETSQRYNIVKPVISEVDYDTDANQLHIRGSNLLGVAEDTLATNVDLVIGADLSNYSLSGGNLIIDSWNDDEIIGHASDGTDMVAMANGYYSVALVYNDNPCETIFSNICIDVDGEDDICRTDEQPLVVQSVNITSDGRFEVIGTFGVDAKLVSMRQGLKELEPTVDQKSDTRLGGTLDNYSLYNRAERTCVYVQQNQLQKSRKLQAEYRQAAE